MSLTAAASGDLNDLPDGLQNADALVAHMGVIDPAKGGDLPAEFHQLLRGRIAAGHIGQSGGKAGCALFHGLTKHPAHLAQLLCRGRLGASACPAAPEVRIAHKAEQIGAVALCIHLLVVAAPCVGLTAVHEGGAVAGGIAALGAVGAGAVAAQPADIRRHALQKLRARLGHLRSPVVRVTVGIDKARSCDAAADVQRPPGRSAGQVAHCGNAAILYADVRLLCRGTGAVQHLPAGQKKVQHTHFSNPSACSRGCTMAHSIRSAASWPP